jgi:hypothetical protein
MEVDKSATVVHDHAKAIEIAISEFSNTLLKFG